MENFMEVLKNEFEAGNGSFLITLRIKLEWDKVAFNRLVSAMKSCAESKATERILESWIAEGFWYVSWFARSWAMHPNFPKVRSAEYYNKAFTRLDDLASWYFTGRSPYKSGHHFEELA